MTVAAYSTDLTDMDLAQSATGWAEATASGWTSVFAVTGGDTDDFIQNNACNSTTVKTGVGVLLYDNGAGITLNTDDAVLIWAKWDAAPLLDIETNGGIRTVMGNALNAFYGFKHLGSDSYPYGGWRNLATGDPADAGVTPDYTVGTPNTTKQFHGWAYNAPTDIPSKGNPYKVDAIRYGRCEIICINGDATTYGTFADMAQENDYNDGTNGYNRWGLFQAIDGGYLWKGLMSLGNATVVDFRDSNVSINIDNTKHVTSNFNKVEINNASSRVDWTGVTFNSLSTASRGNFEVVDDADINFHTCVFNDMGTFIFQAASTVDLSTFRRCNLVTTGGGLFDFCTFDSTNDVSKAVIVSSPANAAKITNSTFINVGVEHGLEIGGTAANITLTNLTWTDYAATDGSVGDEAIYVNIATGTMSITVSGGTTPTIRTAGATVTVNSDTTVTFDTLKDNTEVRVYETGTATEIAGIEIATAGTTDNRNFAWSAASATVVDYVIHNWDGAAPFYQTIRRNGYTVPASDITIEIAQQIDRNPE